MISVHRSLFTAVVLYFAVLTLWGFYLWIRKQGPTPSYRGSVVLGEGLIVLQCLVGALLLATGKRPNEGFLHLLYGFVLLVALPVAYGFVRQTTTFLPTRSGRTDAKIDTAGRQPPSPGIEGRQASLYYALAAALIFVIALFRSSSTG